MENNTFENGSCVENDGRSTSSPYLLSVRISLHLLIVAYLVYHLTKLIIKYKDRLEPVHMFEINTLMDLIVAVVGKTITLTTIYSSKSYFCLIRHFILLVAFWWLMVDLVLCQIDRILAVYWHLTYKQRMTQKSAAVTIAVVKTVLTVTALLTAYFDQETFRCQFQLRGFFLALAFKPQILLYCTLPLFVCLIMSFTMSIYIIKKLMEQKSKRQITLGTFRTNKVVPTVSSKVQKDQEVCQDSNLNQESKEKLFHKRNFQLPYNESVDKIEVEDLEDEEKSIAVFTTAEVHLNHPTTSTNNIVSKAREIEQPITSQHFLRNEQESDNQEKSIEVVATVEVVNCHEMVTTAEVYQNHFASNVVPKSNTSRKEMKQPMTFQQILNDVQDEDMIEPAPLENESQEITFQSNPFLYIKKQLTPPPLCPTQYSLRDLLKATWKVNLMTLFMMAWMTPFSIRSIYNSIYNVNICDYQPGIGRKIHSGFLFFSALLYPVLIEHKLKYF